MQPDPILPPNPNPPAEPGILEELAALTGLFNPEIIWKEEELLDDLDEQAARQATEPDRPTEPAAS